jgi:hypothetical protein
MANSTLASSVVMVNPVTFDCAVKNLFKSNLLASAKVAVFLISNISGLVGAGVGFTVGETVGIIVGLVVVGIAVGS